MFHENRLVRKASVLRRVLVVCRNVAEACKSGRDVNDVMGMLAGLISDHQDMRRDLVLVNAVADGAIESIGRRMEMRQIARIETGLKPFDRKVMGLPLGVMVIGGRSLTGKTELSLRIADHASGLDYMQIHKPMPMNLYAKFKTGFDQVRRSKIWFFNIPGAAIDDLYAKILAAYYRVELALVVVDHLQLVRVPDARGAYAATSLVSKRLKNLQMKLNVPFLLLSQVSRIKSDKRVKDFNTSKLIVLRLQDLRDSGRIEEDAGFVLLIRSPARPSSFSRSRRCPTDGRAQNAPRRTAVTRSDRRRQPPRPGHVLRLRTGVKRDGATGLQPQLQGRSRRRRQDIFSARCWPLK